MLDVCDEYNCIGGEMPLLLCRRRLSPTLIDVMAAEWVRVLRAAAALQHFVQWSPVTPVTRFSTSALQLGGLAVCQNSPLKTNGNCLEKYANFWCHMSQDSQQQRAKKRVVSTCVVQGGASL